MDKEEKILITSLIILLTLVITYFIFSRYLGHIEIMEKGYQCEQTNVLEEIAQTYRNPIKKGEGINEAR